MELSERKKKILSAVIETNVKNKRAEAVSSKQLQEEYLPKLSSATIRNELNALEEMGYLTHLHTSSGRVPTKEGYEKYISELMQEKKLSAKDKQIIQSNFANKLISIKDIIDRSAKTISNATNYTSVVYSNSSKDAIIKDIKLYPVSANTQLVVVVTNERVINELASLGTNDEGDLKSANDIMHELFVGKPLEKVLDQKFRNRVVNAELKKYKTVLDKVLDIIENNQNDPSQKISIVGKDKLMEYPEFNDVSKVKNAVSVFENSNSMMSLVKSGNDLEVSVKVGSDDSGLKDCSIITVTCNVLGSTKITAGVIGPMRMDYPKAISVLKEVAETIEKNLGGNEDQ